MVNYSGALDTTFAALADPIRRAILTRLAHAESSVTELARPFPVSLPAISRHLRVLEGAGLVARRKEGRVHHLRLVAEPLRPATEWIERQRRFWEKRLDALEAYVEQPRKKEGKTWPARNRRPRRRSRSDGPFATRRRRSSAPGPRRRR